MKKLYLIVIAIFLFIHFVNGQHKGPISQVSSTCVDILTVFNDNGYENIDGIKTYSTDSTIYTNEIKISGAEVIRLILEVPNGDSIKPGDVLEIYDGSSTSGTLVNSWEDVENIKDTVFVNSNYATVKYLNGDGADSQFELTWQGIISSEVAVIHNCKQLNNEGEIEIISQGGVPEYTYEWSETGSITNSIIGLDDGVYYYTVTDGLNCKAIDTVTIISPVVMLSTSVDTVGACAGIDNGEISILGVDGIEGTGYTYEWADVNDITNIRTDLANGPYKYTVTDGIGCQDSNTINLERYDVIKIITDSISDYNNYEVSCFGKSDGFIDVFAVGGSGSGYEYLWDEDANFQATDFVKNLSKGSFTVEVIDDNGCISDSTFVLDEPAELEISATIVSVSEYGEDNGEIDIEVIQSVNTVEAAWVGDFSITVDTTKLDQKNLTAGFYTLNLTDENNCSLTEIYEITQPSAIAGGSIDLQFGSSKFVCYSDVGSRILLNDGLAFVGENGTISYEWQYSGDNSNWINTGHTDSSFYEFGLVDTLTQNIYIRRLAERVPKKGGIEYAASNSVMLEFQEKQTLSIYNLDSEYCANSDSVIIMGAPFNGDNLTKFEIKGGVTDNANGTASIKPWLIDTSSNPVTIRYDYNDNGCISTIEELVTINPVPVPGFKIADQYGNTTDTVEIRNITPLKVGETGALYGTGISSDSAGTYFLPSTLIYPASYDITYTITDVNGCTGDSVKKVSVVKATGDIVVRGESDRTEFCFDGDTVIIDASIPNIQKDSLTSYTFDGSVGKIITLADTVGKFIPADFGGGNHTIWFNYTDTVGTSTSLAYEFVVYDLSGRAKFGDLNDSYCQFSSENDIVTIDTLTGDDGCIFTLTRNAFSKSWGSNDSIVLDINNLDTTDYSVNVVPYTLSTVYSYQKNGSLYSCEDTYTKDFLVYGLDSLDFDLKDTFNVQNTTPTEILNIYPVGTTLSGEGIESSTFFNPSTAGEGESTISMQYINTNTSCTTFVDSVVYVDKPQGSFVGINADNLYCYNGAPDTITVNIANGRPGGEFFVNGMSLDNTDTIGVDTLVVRPEKYGKDSIKQISYKYKHRTEDDTYFTISTNIYVDYVGLLSINNLDDSYCEYNGEIQIQGVVDGGPVTKGNFTDVLGTLSNQNNDNGKANFQPNEIIDNGIYSENEEISFIYTSTYGSGICKDTLTNMVTIYNRPNITFTDSLKLVYNQDGPLDTLSATPQTVTSGAFKGVGIIDGILGEFDPSKPAVGTNWIYYEYTDDVTTCYNIDSLDTQIKKANYLFVDTEDKYCYEDVDYTISVNILNTGKSSGFFSGFGITDNGDFTTAVFNPKAMYDQAGSLNKLYTGTVYFTYYVVEEEGGKKDSAKFEISKDIDVRYLEYVEFDISSQYKEVCRDASPVVLTNMPSDIGGTFSMDSLPANVLAGDSFTPLTGSLDYNVILYTYNYDGCTVVREDSILINEKPIITFSKPLKSIYNIKGERDTLIAEPTNGYFTGEAIENTSLGVFNPSLTTGSNSSIIYSCTDVKGCDNSYQLFTELKQAQGVFEDVEDKYCYSDEYFTISITGLAVGAIDGLFSGDGIFDNNNGITADLNPKIVFDAKELTTGEINSQVKYSYKIVEENTYSGQFDTAYFEIIKDFNVNNVSNVTFVIENNTSDSVCRGIENEKENEINLSDFPNTLGGVFYWEHNDVIEQLVGDNFNPFIADSGANIISYIFDNGDCSIVVKDTIFIQEHPVANFDLPPSMCINDSLVLVGYPRGGDFSGQSFTDLRNSLDSTFTDSVKYYAGAAFANGVFSYTVSSDFGCETTIDKLSSTYRNPVPEISTNFAEDFCISGEVVSIFGIDGGNQVSDSNAYFTGDNVVDEVRNGKYEFDPKLYLAGDYTLKFHYTNVNGCTDSIEQGFTIHKLPDVSILNLDKNNYCPNEPALTVNGSPGFGIGMNDGFKINNVRFVESNHVFDPSDFEEGSEVEFVYTHTDANNCTNFDTVIVAINNLPENIFTIDNSCTKEPTQFTYLGNTTNGDFEWIFGGMDTSNVMNPEMSFMEIDNYTISLSVTNPEGCTITKDTIVFFNDGPVADFSWDYECDGNTVNLYNNTAKKTNVNFIWTIDGEDVPTNSDTVTHLFDSPGQYNIQLLADESVKCKDDTLQIINVRPVIDFEESIEYTNSFEDDAYDGWAGVTLNGVNALNTWGKAVPNGINIVSAVDGYMAWVTNPFGKYDVFEISALTSPCFDLSGLKRPMVSFNYWIETVEEFDGAALQYRTNGSDTWEHVGTDTDGINWYNYNAIEGLPGANGDGWTGGTGNWKDAKHDLDKLLLIDSLIQFRFIFSGQQNREMDGFAVDNFRIGERTRRVLIEHFTNTQSPLAASSDKRVNNMIAGKPMDAIDIQYHTSYPEGDRLNAAYPTGANVRSNYYNLTKVPYGLIDGDNELNYNISNEDQINIILNAAMVDPEFEISIDLEKNNNVLTIENDIEALTDISDRQLQIVSAVVEREVSLSGSNVIYENVLRGLLPTASGEYLDKNWSVGDNQLFTFTYEIDDFVSNSNELNIITFIQDENSKEILQAATTDTTTTAVVGIDDLFSNSTGLDIFVYPNPASETVGILLNDVALEGTELKVINQQGRVMISEELMEGIRYKQIDIKILNEGIYFVKCIQENKQVIKKLVIIK